MNILMLPIIVSSALNIFGNYDLPPKKFDHWPSKPVLIINMELQYDLQTACGNTKEFSLAPGTKSYLGCNYKVTNSWDSTEFQVLLLSPISVRAREIKFLGSLGPKEIGCIIVLPRKTDLTPVALWHDYRHEIGHCNGWHHPDETEAYAK